MIRSSAMVEIESRMGQKKVLGPEFVGANRRASNPTGNRDVTGQL
jgi:hypothetical protein